MSDRDWEPDSCIAPIAASYFIFASDPVLSCDACTDRLTLTTSNTNTSMMPAPPLPAGVSFSPGGISGIVDQFTQVYSRIAFGGVSPNFLAADWTIL